MKIKTHGKLIIIPASQDTYRMKDMLKLVPGAKWDTAVGGWTFPAAAMTASALRLMLPQDKKSRCQILTAWMTTHQRQSRGITRKKHITS